MITIKNLHKSFGDLKVIKGIDLSIEAGQVVCIIGPSGSGKSTVLRCINRLEELTSGQIVVDGHDLYAADTDINYVRTEAGMVFQQFNLFPHMNVLQNVTLGPIKVRGMSMRDAGIMDGDLLAVQATKDAKNGQIVVARLGDEVTVKRFKRTSYELGNEQDIKSMK